MEIAKGYLTYGMAIVAVLYGIGGIFMGWHDMETGQVMIWTGFAVFGIRRAMPK